MSNWIKVEMSLLSIFIQFDIDQFYSRISENLLIQASIWALQFVNISDEEKNIILSTKKNLLYSEGEAWVKKGEGEPWDITMGSWDGAEVCDLIGLFSLSKCQDLGLNIGLYRDDGLAQCKKRPQQVENVKKTLCQIFRNLGLKISVEAIKKIVNLLK